MKFTQRAKFTLDVLHSAPCIETYNLQGHRLMSQLINSMFCMLMKDNLLHFLRYFKFDTRRWKVPLANFNGMGWILQIYKSEKLVRCTYLSTHHHKLPNSRCSYWDANLMQLKDSNASLVLIVTLDWMRCDSCEGDPWSLCEGEFTVSGSSLCTFKPTLAHVPGNVRSWQQIFFWLHFSNLSASLTCCCVSVQKKYELTKFCINRPFINQQSGQGFIPTGPCLNFASNLIIHFFE